MIARDILDFISSSAAVAGYIAALILLGGLVSGVVALGVMQTGIRASIQRSAFWNFFLARKSEIIRHDLKRFIEAREALLFNLHYRQLAGQLLAIATNECRNSPTSAPTRPLTDAFLSLEVDRSSNDFAKQPFPRKDDDLERVARWIDLLQGALGRAVGGAIIWGTAIPWMVILLIVAFAAIGGSGSIHAVALSQTYLQAAVAFSKLLVLVVASLSIALALAWPIAAASLFTFTVLDKVAGAR